MAEIQIKKVPLKHPIQHGSESIAEITLRRPKAGDMRGVTIKQGGEVDFDHMLTLAGRLSGKPQSVIDEIDFEDMKEVFTVIGGFIKGGPTTGKTP